METRHTTELKVVAPGLLEKIQLCEVRNNNVLSSPLIIMTVRDAVYFTGGCRIFSIPLGLVGYCVSSMWRLSAFLSSFLGLMMKATAEGLKVLGSTE